MYPIFGWLFFGKMFFFHFVFGIVEFIFIILGKAISMISSSKIGLSEFIVLFSSPFVFRPPTVSDQDETAHEADAEKEKSETGSR